VKIAYLINQYPKVSHTFIRREILALERRGFHVTRIALRGWDGDLVDIEDQRERDRTRYILRDGFVPLIVSLLRMLVTRPVKSMGALALAWRMGHRSDRPFPLHFAYLAEALADAGMIVGLSLNRLQLLLTGRADNNAPHRLPDAIRHSVFLKGFRLKDVQNPALGVPGA
jgi:hypothetical protein